MQQLLPDRHDEALDRPGVQGPGVVGAVSTRDALLSGDILGVAEVASGKDLTVGEALGRGL